MVIVATADGEKIIELGDGPATVTITSDGDVVEVESTGDVEVIELEWPEDIGDLGFPEELEAFETCEGLLPDIADGAVTVESVTPAEPASRTATRGS